MINQVEYIPVTSDSHPFARAELACKLSEKGYLEDEYFISGTANVYEEDEAGNPKVLYDSAPYVNRILVRRPEDVSKFSGNVVVEILNPSARIDIDRVWVETWRFMVRNGDIYIGITAKSDVLDALYKVDPKRYERISWKNPLPGRPLPKPGLFPVLEEYENGLFWDMLSDLAVLLKQGGQSSPLQEYGKLTLFLAGWSQCGGFITRYRETFADAVSEKLGEPVFDGYYHSGAGASRAPINSFAESESFWEARQGFKGYIESKEPFMVINTETETPFTRWGGDMDKAWTKFRVYEIAGSSHDSKYNLIDYYETDTDLQKLGRGQPFYGIEPYPLDYPYEYQFSAALRNLYVWVREGVPAPASRKVDRLPDGQSPKDAFGNTTGGLRMPFIDYPTCLYSKYCTLKEDPTKTRDFWGHVEPFSADFLNTLYGSLDKYRSLVTTNTDDLIAEGYLLQMDRDDIIADAVARAKERGLK